MDGYGNGDGYGNDDRTRDFLSQPDPYSPAGGYDIFNDAAHPFPGSSNVNAPWMGMTVLDLNSHGEGWPRMPSYEGLLRSGPQGGGIGGPLAPRPIRVRNGSRTLGLRAARSGGGGGAMAGRVVSSSSDGGRGPPLPPVNADVHGMRGSISSVPTGSRSSGGRRGATTSAVAEDNFNINP